MPRTKRVALTFDDGPAESTTTIVEILEAKEAPATFFVVGRRARRLPDVVRRVAGSAYAEVGNHTWSHADLVTLPEEEVRHEITRASDLLRDLCGGPVTAFRPPRGHHDRVVRDIAAQAGLDVILFSLNPKDWANQDADAVVETILGQARDGDVVVLHDTLVATAAAVGRIIDGLRERGFVIVPHRELTGDLAPGTWSDGATSGAVRAARYARRQPQRLRAHASRLARSAGLRPGAITD
jgi:peptidoglycan/xylan/chitin deacetylase (PgdA/CDA1 family)